MSVYSSFLRGARVLPTFRRATPIAFKQVTPFQTRSFATQNAPKEKLFNKILIANRGEIACRIMRTCRKLGIKTVAIYSEPDKYNTHVLMADEAYCVGPALSAQSYLSIPNILKAVKDSGAEAVHPGYGFLSENHNFQEALQAIGVKFIGPGTKAITAMGDKISSKTIAKKAGVNVIPGYLGEVSESEVVKIANEIGYPVMVKASGGGGGKGMRIAYNDEEARSGYQLSKAEAKSSFGNDVIFVEKYIEQPRHIEIQLLLDSHGNGVYLNERECTIQRRNQKVIEEAPSSFLDPATRKQMGEQALQLAKAVGYESAGTCEFLVDKNRNFAFLEMNTRLQVEHPITEQITGVDVVEQMIRVAAGHKLPFTQDDIKINGWAFEARVYAEDPLRGFLPSIGQLRRYIEPVGPNIRVDSGIREGSEISIHYDPMISKLITFGKTRAEALQFMRDALDSYVVRGVTHNINFLRSLCDHPRFISGNISTKFIPEEYPNGYKGATLTLADEQALIASAVMVYSRIVLSQLSMANAKEAGQNPSFSPSDYHAHSLHNLVVTFLGNNTQKIYDVDMNDFSLVGDTQRIDMKLHNFNDSEKVSTPVVVMSSFQRGDIVFQSQINNKTYTLQVVKISDGSSTLSIQYAGTTFNMEIRNGTQQRLLKYMPVKEVVDTSKLILSPMPGAIYSVKVQAGQEVVPGQEVVIVEAMKMQNALRAVNAGVVKRVLVTPGQTVSADQVLIEFE